MVKIVTYYVKKDEKAKKCMMFYSYVIFFFRGKRGIKKAGRIPQQRKAL